MYKKEEKGRPRWEESRQEGDVLLMMLMKMMKVTLSDKEEGESKGEERERKEMEKRPRNTTQPCTPSPSHHMHHYNLLAVLQLPKLGLTVSLRPEVTLKRHLASFPGVSHSRTHWESSPNV
jgi:hypothetical protein